MRRAETELFRSIFLDRKTGGPHSQNGLAMLQMSSVGEVGARVSVRRNTKDPNIHQTTIHARSLRRLCEWVMPLGR